MTLPWEPYRSRSSGDPRHVVKQDRHLDVTSAAGEKEAAAVKRRQGEVVNSREDDSMGRGDVAIGARPDPVTGEQSPFSYVTDFKRPRRDSTDPIVTAMRKSAGRGQHHLTFNLLESGLQPADVYRAIHRRSFDGSTKEPGMLPQEVHAIYRDSSGREQIKVFNNKTLRLIAEKSGVPKDQLDNIFIKQGERKQKKTSKAPEKAKPDQKPSQTPKKQPKGAADKTNNSRKAEKKVPTKLQSTAPYPPKVESSVKPTAEVRAKPAPTQGKRVSGGPKQRPPSPARVERAREYLKRKSKENGPESVPAPHSEQLPTAVKNTNARTPKVAEASPSKSKTAQTATQPSAAPSKSVSDKRRGGPLVRPPSAKKVAAAKASQSNAAHTKPVAAERKNARQATPATPAKKTEMPKKQVEKGQGRTL